jgi:hypothetical protein
VAVHTTTRIFFQRNPCTSCALKEVCWMSGRLCRKMIHLCSTFVQ